MAFRSTIGCVAGLIALAAITGSAWGRGGTLDHPELWVAKDYPEADFRKLKAVLEHKDVRFLGGSWINTHKSLQYGGDTAALNQFVEGLSRCAGVTVRVRFIQPNPGVPYDWAFTQNAMSQHEMVVLINLGSKNLKIQDLTLPPVKAENVPE